MTAALPRFPGAVLTIDLDAIAENWRTLAGLSAPAACAAVVKADGYGLGAAPVAAALSAAGCRTFFVARLDEGVSLRETLSRDATIYVLDGPIAGDESNVLDAHDLIPVLNSPGDIETWSGHAARNGGRRAVLALDTGMNRLGLTTAEVDALSSDPGLLDGISLDYVMSHLACADQASHPMNVRQRKNFDALRAKLPDVSATFANSGGIFLGPDFHYDLVRPGAALYGVSRSTGAPEPMQQVVGLKAKILQIRVVDSESTVGYGAAQTVPAGSRLATVAAGYADGYLRSLGSSGHGYAAGVKVPVTGRISMDLMTFDISNVPPNALYPGDYIDLICDRYTVDDLGDAAGTIGYEILTSLGSRYERLYTGDAA